MDLSQVKLNQRVYWDGACYIGQSKLRQDQPSLATVQGLTTTDRHMPVLIMTDFSRLRWVAAETLSLVPELTQAELTQKFGQITTPQFWECSCTSNWLHAHAQDKCPFCQAERDESPDARVLDCLDAGLPVTITAADTYEYILSLTEQAQVSRELFQAYACAKKG